MTRTLYRVDVRVASAILTAALLLVATEASARSNRVRQIPNGNNYTCDSCHGKSSLRPQDLTPFGVDVNNTLSGGNVNWSAIWDRDSDGDGFSNGLELGDPNGTWRTGNPDPNSPTANPGIPNTGICGNQQAESDEDCEANDFKGQTCQSLGFGAGTLKCHALCRWDTSECGFCGDGYLNPNYEDCDSDKFPDALTCVEYGFLRGELSCDENCDIDESTCTDEAPAVCGDGVISRGEFCDGDNFGTVDCVRIAYAGGTLNCTDDCKWDAADCLLPDGRRVGDEERAAEDPGDPAPGVDAGPTTSLDGGDSDADVAAPAGTAEKSCATVAGGGDAAVLLLVFAALWRRRTRSLSRRG